MRHIYSAKRFAVYIRFVDAKTHTHTLGREKSAVYSTLVDVALGWVEGALEEEEGPREREPTNNIQVKKKQNHQQPS